MTTIAAKTAYTAPLKFKVIATNGPFQLVWRSANGARYTLTVARNNSIIENFTYLDDAMGYLSGLSRVDGKTILKEA